MRSFGFLIVSPLVVSPSTVKAEGGVGIQTSETCKSPTSFPFSFSGVSLPKAKNDAKADTRSATLKFDKTFYVWCNWVQDCFIGDGKGKYAFLSDYQPINVKQI
jgi:hypothetical protein